MSKQKISFNDLGLSTALPEVLTKTVTQKSHEKLVAKKEKCERVQQAVSALSSSKEVVGRHKEFVENEKVKTACEKAERKRQLKADHIKARRERELLGQKRDAEHVESQKVVTAAAERLIVEKEKSLEELRQKIREQDEQEIKSAAPSIYVPVHRTQTIQDVRASLPVVREEQAIVEAVNESSSGCVLICGETGSGKTTQIPQFLWECGYSHTCGEPAGREGKIVVTEPRRVAAVAMGKRVAEELNEEFGGTVGYQVRYDNNLSTKCQLKFVTEGILLRELQSDILLKQYSVVIVDEAHERSVSGDILVGMLSRIVPLRSSLASEGTVIDGRRIAPLKLVIMSATLRVSDFRDNRLLFPREPPLINVEARRFPVSNHFARATEMRRYCDEAIQKVKQVHKKLPPGGILVFLATQREVESTCTTLRRYYSQTRIFYDANNYNKHAQLGSASSESAEVDAFGVHEGQYELEGDSKYSRPSDSLADFGLQDDFDYSQVTAVDADDEHVSVHDHSGLETIVESEGGSESGEVEDGSELPFVQCMDENEADGSLDSLHILPLYALLNFESQQLVFQEPPAGKRLCVVATNVAETSITIPGIRYVIDSGRVKTKKLDRGSGASTYSIEWTSQASAEQRAGRAGRTGPGHCYRLYSTGVFTNHMSAHSIPEILRTPMESVVLLMKSLGINDVAKFPFPTAPRQEDLELAMKHLIVVGGVDRSTLRITSLGKAMLRFPVAPRFAKMITTALQLNQTKVTEMVVCFVAVASTTLDIFEHGTVQEASKRQDVEKVRIVDQKRLLHSGSDLITFLRAVGVFSSRPTVSTCQRFNIVHKTMVEANQLKKQLQTLINDGKGDATALLDDEKENDADERPKQSRREQCSIFDMQGVCSLTSDSEILLRKIAAIGLTDQIARKATVHECRARNVTFMDGKTSKVPYLDVKSGSIVFIHPSSSVASTHPPPDFVAYCGLQQSRSESKVTRTFMKGVTSLAKSWLNEIGYDEELVRSAYERPLGTF